jgi:uncharacterized cupin superfamily protein
MHKYKPGDDVGELEFWPFDNPASDYRIVEGEPKTYGRIDQGGDGHTTRYGIWRCTAGTFDCNEQGEELMTVLSGRCRITWLDSGEVCDLGPVTRCSFPVPAGCGGTSPKTSPRCFTGTNRTGSEGCGRPLQPVHSRRVQPGQAGRDSRLHRYFVTAGDSG